MNRLTIAVFAITVAGLPCLSLAQGDATPRVDQRQANQQKRIEQGVKSGELNRREAARLEKGQERVQRMEDKAKADGNVTAREKARIHHTQNIESKRIRAQKHDRQHAK